MRAGVDGAVTRRRAAAVGYWAVAVLLVTNVAVVYGWLDPVPPADVVDVPGPGPSPSPTPVDVTLADGAVVTFPSEPIESNQVLRIAGSDALLRLHTAQGADGTTYNLGEIDYPPQVNLTDPATNLIASVSGAAGNVSGRVVEQDVTTYQGAPAVEFVIEAADVRLRARHVLDGRRLYAQNVAYRGEEEPDDADSFFASLRLPAAASPSPAPSPAASP